jgi:hypothetical protein
MQPPPFPASGQIRYQTPRRGYLISWAPDLLGGTVVYRSWYGLQSRRGGGKVHNCPSIEEARALIEKIDRRRVAHGYEHMSRLPWQERQTRKPSVLAKDDLAQRAKKSVRRLAREVVDEREAPSIENLFDATVADGFGGYAARH